MAIPAGTRLGPYEVLSAIGAGGMGEVYRARDSKLGRDVALKVLPAAFHSDSERMARFEREARLLAALNHPNIAAIYGLEESSGTPALVMELVEGPTLADRIASGPIPLDEALPIAKQIAEALEYAHERGVIHRDLKPANIKVKADGTVKVLDFGLAKALTDDSAAMDLNNSPTLTMGATMQGVILGTAAYMSPEQAKGKPVDRRSDIWAFGVVLYEMLTGEELFRGETVADTMASVMKDEPTLDKLPSDTPSAIRTLFRRCLEKNLRRRLSHIAEARMTIEDVLSGAVATTSSEVAAAPTAAATGNRERVAWAAAGICLLAALMLAFVHFRTPPADDARVLSLSVLMPEKTSFSGRSMPAVSPDGKHLAFVAGTGNRYNLWVRDLDSLTARSLDGTDGASEPFWSPDSRYIGFFAGGNLKRVDPTGGPALALCDLPGGAGTGFGASWSSRDVILFTPSNNAALFEVPAAGGSAISLTVLGPGEISHRFPWFLPDGRHFLYLSRNADQSKTAVYMGDLDLKDRRLIAPVQSNVVYAPGQLLFVRGSALMRQAFDAGKAQTTGDPVPVASQVGANSGGIIGQGLFSASQNGVLAYAPAGSTEVPQLKWFDRTGKLLSSITTPDAVLWAAISPDGNTVAEDHPDPQTGAYDVWLHDLKRGTASRFTFNSLNRYPVWSPDGSHIAFTSVTGSAADIYQKAARGSGQEEVLDKDARNKRPDDWSRDGRYIIEEVVDAKTGGDLWVLPLFGDRKPFPYLQTSFNEHHAKLSPDGHWLAYVSDETKRDEVYVQSFPAPGGKWQISTNGGDIPVWSKDGTELFFVGRDNKLMAVRLKESAGAGGQGFEAGVPQSLFDTQFPASAGAGFDVSKDGRFLIPTYPEGTGNTAITVVVNWTAGLKK